MELRKYQVDAIRLLRDAFRDGYRKPILRLDCGAGKTVIAAKIALECSKNGNKVLFLVHSRELLKQTEQTFKNFNLDPEYVQVGMVLTVGNNLDKYKPDVIIADECNFALAKTWRNVFKAYPNAYIIGLSATPLRLSGEPMGDVFDKIIEVIDVDFLINNNYLSDYNYYAPKLDFNTKDIKSSCGDFNSELLAELLDRPKIYGDVIKYFKELVKDSKTIVYCCSIKHSENTARILRENGFNAEHFDGNTSTKERERIVQDFRDGKIQVLCNCNLISFGFDVPDCECTVLLRPTQSLTLYIQQAMRSMRYLPGKLAKIVDFVGNCHRFGLPTDKRDYSLEGRIKTTNRDGLEEVLGRCCKKCLRYYSGHDKMCPYCGNDNGKTRAEIKADKEAELELIRSIDIRKKKKEVGMARTFDQLVAIGQKRRYKNPQFWAKCVMKGRINR